ncbi:MAG: AMP-binding protein, partial [bacterium]|nr:AMP-binding protein [bacterium]
YQFEELVETLNISRDASRNPLFDVMFLLQNMDIAKIEIPGLKLKPLEYENKTAKFDLMLQAMEEGEELKFKLQYRTKLFKKTTIERYIIYFKNLISTATAHWMKKITEIEIISREEKRQLLVEFNETRTEYPAEKTVHKLFEEEAERKPGKVAAVYEAQSITYGALNRRAGNLAAYLRHRGVSPGEPVGIMSEATLETTVGILAILKAGGAYLPINPEYPRERKRCVIADSR